jgi:hypothetical protein
MQEIARGFIGAKIPGGGREQKLYGFKNESPEGCSIYSARHQRVLTIFQLDNVSDASTGLRLWQSETDPAPSDRARPPEGKRDFGHAHRPCERHRVAARPPCRPAAERPHSGVELHVGCRDLQRRWRCVVTAWALAVGLCATTHELAVVVYE